MSAGLLSGFTITNGHTLASGGLLKDRCGGGVNLADGNGIVSNCVISGNMAGPYGGGSYGGTLYDCTFSGNSAGDGGGNANGTLHSCVLSCNKAGNNGGGSHYGTLNNCLLFDNAAGNNGGGTYIAWLTNCTLSDNSATNQAGGSCNDTLTNCIVYGNTAPAWNDVYKSSAANSCSPDLSHGINGCITSDPEFIDASSGDYRIGYGSPCIDTGAAIAGMTRDIIGNFRPVDGDLVVGAVIDMGAYEYDPGTTDTDGDGMSDKDEYHLGFDPVRDSSNGVAYGEAIGEFNVTNNPGAYDLYTSNSIMDLSMGYLMLQVSNDTVWLNLQLEHTHDLNAGWSNAGDIVTWTNPALPDKDFFRVSGDK